MGAFGPIEAARARIEWDGTQYNSNCRVCTRGLDRGFCTERRACACQREWMTFRKESAGLRQISTKAEPESASSEHKRAQGIFSV